jgi:hypothetical protein
VGRQRQKNSGKCLVETSGSPKPCTHLSASSHLAPAVSSGAYSLSGLTTCTCMPKAEHTACLLAKLHTQQYHCLLVLQGQAATSSSTPGAAL